MSGLQPHRRLLCFTHLAFAVVASLSASAAASDAPAAKGDGGNPAYRVPNAGVISGNPARPPFPLICSGGAAGQLPGSRTMASPPARATLPANPTRGPIIERVNPSTGHAGDHVTIHGRRFGAQPKVIFNEVPAQVLRSSDTAITVAVPASTTFPVVVETADGATEAPEPFIYSLKTENGVIFPIPVGGGWWFPDKPFWDTQPVDPAAKFLLSHWQQPLPPQGKAPDIFTPPEADLRPEACAGCHLPQYKDWKGALHSTTASALVRWIAREKDPVEANSCRQCHDAESQPGAWTELELFRAVGDPAELPRRDGVQCSVCHVRQHVRYGPPALPREGPAVVVPLHGGFKVESAYEDSRFCAGCHTFTPRVNPGGMVADPFEEWRRSRFAREGVSCQGCHMPQRQHLFRGIHDREMTLSGLTLGLAVRRDEAGGTTATATVTSTNIGHMFPTYPIPRVHVQLLCDETPLGESHVIGRDVDLAKSVENWDRRIAPGESYVMRRSFRPGRQVTLRIDVVPRDRYENDLRIQLAAAERVPDHVFRGVVQQLLDNQVNRRYRLIDLTVDIPSGPGTAQRVIKEGREVQDPARP